MTETHKAAVEALEASLRYVDFIASNHTERGEPHPQQHLRDVIISALTGLHEFSTLKQPSSVEVTVEEAEIVDRSEPFFSGDTWEMQAAVEAITRAGFRITRAAATDGVKS